MLVILAISLVCAWGGVGAAGEIGYSLRGAERGFARSHPEPPSSAVVAADAVIGRPLGLATTIAGAGVFLVTLPMSLASESTREAAWGLSAARGAGPFLAPWVGASRSAKKRGVFQPKRFGAGLNPPLILSLPESPDQARVFLLIPRIITKRRTCPALPTVTLSAA